MRAGSAHLIARAVIASAWVFIAAVFVWDLLNATARGDHSRAAISAAVAAWATGVLILELRPGLVCDAATRLRQKVGVGHGK